MYSLKCLLDVQLGGDEWESDDEERVFAADDGSKQPTTSSHGLLAVFEGQHGGLLAHTRHHVLSIVTDRETQAARLSVTAVVVVKCPGTSTACSPQGRWQPKQQTQHKHTVIIVYRSVYALSRPDTGTCS